MVWVVNEHERLSIFTLRHKLKKRNSAFIAVLYFPVTVGSGLMSITRTLKCVCTGLKFAVEYYTYFLFLPPIIDYLQQVEDYIAKITWGRGSWFMQGLLFYFSLHSLMIHVIQFGIIVAKLLWNIYFNLDFVLWLTKCVNYI